MKRLVWLAMAAAVWGSAACSTIFGDIFLVVTNDGGTDGGTGADAGGTTSGTTSETSPGDAGVDVVSCDAAAPTVCASGCADVATDVKNCGRCGHDCLYGACKAEVCQPWTVATGVDVGTVGTLTLKKVNQLVVGSKYVAWIDSNGGVHQVPIGGGSEILVSQTAAAGNFDGPVLANGVLAFIGAGSSAVYTVAEGANSASVMATIDTTQYTADNLALDPTGAAAFLSAKVVGSSQYKLLHCPLNGSACTALSYSGSSSFAFLHVTMNDAYFGSPSSLNSVNFMTGTPGSVSATVEVLALDSSNVFWTDSQTIYMDSQALTGSPTTLATNTIPVLGLAADDSNAYYGTLVSGANANLYTVPISDGGMPTTLFASGWFAQMGSAEAYLATAGSAVYWADVDFDTMPAKSNIMGLAAP